MANVLIVDDDTAMRDELAETIADLGHAPRVAASGREAMQALALTGSSDAIRNVQKTIGLTADSDATI